MAMPNDRLSTNISRVIQAPTRDVDGLTVRRALPSAHQRLVGPFIFFDHLGPAHLPPGQGLDVRPHPHIALATVTFLFEGEIIHRDSLGYVQAIRPGDVNWMIAGRGIVHSERSSEEARKHAIHLHGIQCWVALPLEHEEAEPSFAHHPAGEIPKLQQKGVTLDVIAGSAYGLTSPAKVLSPTLYVHAKLDAETELTVGSEHEERAIYVVEGAIELDQQVFTAGALIVLNQGSDVTVRSNEATRLMLLGGQKLAGERHVYWNFVSSNRARIEQAKADWQHDRMGQVPGETERIPLPT